MKRVIYSFAVLSITAVWFFPGCRKNNPVEPPFNIRQLNWSIDTLAHPDNWQLLLFDIRGSSANDVYAVGNANTTRGILWHYNGRQWTDIKISVTQGGPIRGPISFREIFCFGKNDVWVCGDRHISNPNPPPDFWHTNLLIHWDGIKWEDVVIPFGYDLHSIWGLTPDNVWFGGAFGTLYHYDGAVVKKDSVPLEIPYNISEPWIFTSITGNESETDMLLWGNKGRDSYYYLFQHQDNQWIIADSSFIYNTKKLWMSPSGTLYAIGETTYQCQGSAWTKFLEWSTSLHAHSIHGTSDNNLFAVGSLAGVGTVLHYNGRDWYSFNDVKLPDVTYYDVWTDGKEVFVSGWGGNISIVLHGK